MPKLRRLSGKDVIEILQRLGYTIVLTRGSHFRLELLREVGGKCRVTVPVHGKQTLTIPTLKSIYRDVVRCLSEEIAHPLFYT